MVFETKYLSVWALPASHRKLDRILHRILFVLWLIGFRVWGLGSCIHMLLVPKPCLPKLRYRVFSQAWFSPVPQ